MQYTTRAWNQTLKLALESTRTGVDTSAVNFTRPQYSYVTQQLLQPKKTIAKTQDPSYHKGVAGSVSTQEEKITGDIESFEYQKVKYEYIDVTKNRAQESVTRSLDPNFNNGVEEEIKILLGEEGKVTVESEEVDGELKPLDFKKTIFEPLKQVVWKHITDEVASYDAKYLSGEEKKITLEKEELGEAIEPYKIESCTFSTVSQEMYSPNSEEVKAAAPNYLQATEDEVVVTAEQTRKGDPPIPWEKAAVEKIEEAGTFEGIALQTPTYEVIENLDGKVETVTLEKTEAPQYNEGIENTLEKLQLEKVRRLQPPIIERAEVNVIEVDKSTPVYVSQQAVEQVPLAIHTAVEGDLPKWEQCEDVEFEELRTTKATPKVALGQLYTAKGRQPKVDFAEKQSPVISDEVYQVKRPISPPPKGNFKVNEKLLELALGETEDIPQVEKKSAKVSLVPKAEENKADSNELQTLYMDMKFADENENYLQLGEVGDLESSYALDKADISLADMDAFGQVEVVAMQMKKLDLPKLEFHEEQEQITVADVNLSPIVISPKPKQLHAEYHVEETEDYPDYSLSLQAVPRSLLKEAHEETVNELSDNVLEVPEIRYSDPKKAEIPQMETHVAGKATVESFKAPKIHHGEEYVEHVRPEESEPLADMTNTSATSGEVAILDLWKALIQESTTELDTLQAKETNINMVGLEVISDITPLSPDIAKEFDLPDESYIQVEQAPKTETSVYVPPPELKNSQEAVLLLKEHEIVEVPYKKDIEGKAKVLAVPTQRLENVQSSKTEILQAQNFAEEHVIDTRQDYIYIIPPSGGEDAQVTTLPKTDMDKAHAQSFRMQQFPEERTIDLKEEVILTIDDPSSLTVSSSMLPQQQMDRANAQRYRIQQLASEQVIDVKEQRVIVIEPPDSTTAGTSSLPHLEMDRARAERYRIQQLAQEGEEELEEQKVDTIHPHSSDAARGSTLPHLEMDRARSERYRVQQMAQEGSVDLKELQVDTIQPHSSDGARESTLPHLRLDQAHAERYRIQQMAQEGSVDLKELKVIWIDRDSSDAARESTLPHLRLDQAHAERYRIQQLAGEGEEKVEEHKVDEIHPNKSDAARESTLPHLEMDRARAERYRVQQMAQEGSVDLKELKVILIDHDSSDAARESTLPHLRLDQAHAERYRIQQLAGEGEEKVEEHKVDTIHPHTSDAARESTLPHLEMDRARAERYRIQQLAQEGSVDMKEHAVGTIQPHASDAARESTLPHVEMDRAQAERYRIQQLAREGSYDIREQHVNWIDPHTSDAARRSTLPHVEMDQARSERYRIQQLAQEGSVEVKEHHVSWTDPHSLDAARRTTLPHMEMDRAKADRNRIQQLAQEGSVEVKEHHVNWIDPHSSDAARRSTQPHVEMDRARAERHRIQQLAQEGSYDIKEQHVNWIDPHSSDAARRSTQPHVEMDRARAERHRIQQLAQEGSYDIKEQHVNWIDSHSSDAARRTTLPHVEMDRAQAERYRIQQLAQEGSYDIKEQHVNWIDPHSSDAARRSTLPHVAMDRAQAERYRIQQLAQEGSVDMKDHAVGTIQPHLSDAAMGSTLPHMEMDRAQAERYRIQQLAQEGSVDVKEQRVNWIDPHTSDAARRFTLPHMEMDRAQAERYRIQQLAQEGSVDMKEHAVGTIQPHASDAARESTLPHVEMDRARAERYRIQQLGQEGSYNVKEHAVGTIHPHPSDAAMRSTLPHLELDHARTERFRIHQRGREEVLRVREAYVDRIPSSSHHHHGRVIVVDGYPMHRMRPKPTTWTEIPAPRVRHPPRETVVNSSARNVIGVIPPLATDAARQGSIPAEVLQKVREQRVDSQQAPADERNVHERVEITSVIPPLPADIAHKAETPAEVFRRVHSHHVHSHNAYSGQETNLNEVVESQKPLPPLETRTSMWRLVPGHETARARSTSKESHYMPETEVADEPIPPVERTVPAQQVVTSDEFHRADASTLHSSWVPAEIQVVGELDTLMQQGIIRFNPLSQLVENGVDGHDYDEMFMVKQHSGIRRSSSLQYPVNTGHLRQTDNFKVGHIPQVGYPTKQWTSAQQLASETVEDRGDDDFDYDKLIRMTTGGKHEVTDDQLPKSGWSTVEVTGQDNVAEQQQRSMERIYNRQDSVFIDHRKPQPRIRSDRPPFAFDFSRLIHWTVGEQNEVAKLPTHPGANPPHLVPINFDKTTTWVVGTDPGSGTAPEKTYVSVAVPVRVRNTYFVEGSDARSDTRSDIVKSPEVTVLHDMQDWKTLTRQGGRSVYSAMGGDPQYSSAPPLQTFQGYHQPYDGAYGDSRQLRGEGSVDSSTSGRVKRRAPQPPVQRATSPVQHVYTSSPPARPTSRPVSQAPASAHAFHVQSLQNGYASPPARPLSPPHESRYPSIPAHPKGPAPQPPAPLTPPSGTADTTVPKAVMVNGRHSPSELDNGDDYVDLRRDSEVSSVSSYGSQKGVKRRKSSSRYFPIFRRSSSKESLGKRPSVLDDRSPTGQPKRREGRRRRKKDVTGGYRIEDAV
ncbi:Hypp415 [Branchiostoma lanceolatum]|uniref:Hypp415 protein n=1 Tax=Branchiostoma lanceolatum TaxID=7740 RepID=A0A8J9YPK7_BRALA|nr:Hypp415 [Branchiostoma lanceolatum]